MALSAAITFFIGISVSVSLWARLLYKEEKKSQQRNQMIVQAFRSAGW